MRLGLSHGAVSFWETGRRAPTTEDVAALLAALHVVGEEREEILGLARHVSDGSWLTTGVPGAPAQLAGVMECERAAVEMIEWAPMVVPGLLQTSDYARAVFAAGDHSTQDLETRVMLRLARREVLERAKSLRLRALVGEQALREQLATPPVMRQQYAYLLTVSRRPNIEIRVVRSNVGWHPGLMGPFILFGFDDQPDVLYLEHHRTGAFTPDEDDVRAYHEAVSRMETLALSTEESREFIETLK